MFFFSLKRCGPVEVQALVNVWCKVAQFFSSWIPVVVSGVTVDESRTACEVSKHESASTNWSPTEGQGWALKTVSKYRALTTRLKKVKTRSGREDNKKNYNKWKVKTKDKKHDNRILSEWGLIQRTGVASFPISDYKWATPGWGIESGKVKWFVERTKCIWTSCRPFYQMLQSVNDWLGPTTGPATTCVHGPTYLPVACWCCCWTQNQGRTLFCLPDSSSLKNIEI